MSSERERERNMVVVTGHARACSTLMCNILTDNPKLRASSTSALCLECRVLVDTWSQSIDIKEMLLRDPTGGECRDTTRRKIRALIEARHPLKGQEELIFDKSRDWLFNYDLLRAAYPDTRMIVMVRDLRDIVASIELPLRENGLTPDGRPKLFEQRLNQYFSEDPVVDLKLGKVGLGIIGGPLLGIKDLIMRGDGTVLHLAEPEEEPHKHILFVRAEDLQRDPKLTMQHVYRFIGEDYWHPPHNYKDVGDHATDPDPLYLNLFRHEGCGKVLPPKPNAWSDMMSKEVADAIIRNPNLLWYHREFRYISDAPPERVDPLGDGCGDSSVVLKKTRTRSRKRRR